MKVKHKGKKDCSKVTRVMDEWLDRYRLVDRLVDT
jgi:hypothetical protein